MQRSDIFTVSNLLSFIRIFLVVPIAYYIYREQNDLALIIIVISMLTDWLDGYLARKLNQITEVGKIIDPAADKICIAGGMIALSIFQGFPLWLTIAIIARDLLIVLGAVMMFGKSHIVPPSNKTGKITVFFVASLTIFFMLKVQWIQLPLQLIVLILLVISLIAYTRAFYKNVKQYES